MREWFLDRIGGPLTTKDWVYITILVVLGIFMGAMVPVWMQIDWLIKLSAVL